MEKEVIERLTRVEAKLDFVLPYIERVSGIEKDISFVKKAIGILGTFLVTVGAWVATYLGSKH